MKKIFSILFACMITYAFVPAKSKSYFVIKEEAMEFFQDKNEKFMVAKTAFKVHRDSMETFKRDFAYTSDCRKPMNVSADEKAKEQQLYDSVKAVMKKFHARDETLQTNAVRTFEELKPAMEDSVKISFERFCQSQTTAVVLIDRKTYRDQELHRHKKLNLTAEYLRFVRERK